MKKLTPRQARQRAGMRREDLAAKAKVSLSTIARAEQSGEWPTHPLVRMAYLAALGLTDQQIGGAK